MRVLYHTHYFAPEVGAAQTRILESAKWLRGRGHDVIALTGFPNYPDGVIPERYRRRLLQTEWIDDIRVVRSAVYPAPNRGFTRRVLNHTSFAVSSALASRATGPIDVMISETPPLFTPVAAVPVARARGVPLVVHVADLWPETAVQLGALSNPTAIRLAEALERFAYRNAALITVPTPGMVDILLERGYAEDHVLLVPNAVDVERFAPAVHRPRDRPRLVYCGTVGIAHGLRTLLDSVRLMEEDGSELDVLIVGDGAERQELQSLAADWGLRSVTFKGRVPPEQVPEIVGSADVAALALRDVRLFDHALPTKLLEYLAAGIPVAAAAAGQVSDLINTHRVGIATPAENSQALAESIRRLVAEPALRAELGANGRRYVEANLSRHAVMSQVERALERVVQEDAERQRIRSAYAGYAASPRRRRVR